MDMLNINNIINIIPVAVILSVIIFLVKFFGKAYSDQVPFTDDRSWHEEIFGISFFSYQILSPAISVLILFSKGLKFWRLLREDWLLLGISLLVFISSVIIDCKSKKFFNDDNFFEGNYFSSLKKISDPNIKKIDDSDRTVLLRVLFFPVITILLMWGTLLLYKWGAYYHLISALIILFFYFTTLALMLSLVKRHILKANIYFINKQEKTIKCCRVIKVNNDNVKIKTKDGKFVIINKSLISRIEFVNKSLIIYVLGVDHCKVQIPGEQNDDQRVAQYIEQVKKICKDKHVELIAEEISHDALDFINAKYTNIGKIISQIGIDYILCDPGREERIALGLKQREDAAKEMCINWPPANQNDEDRINEYVAPSDHKREKYWIDQIKSQNKKVVLLICGFRHTNNFIKLADQEGIKAEKVE